MKKVVVLHFVNNVYLGYFFMQKYCLNQNNRKKVDPAYFFAKIKRTVWIHVLILNNISN